ncbi:50S ribosomal protein L35 [Candidatus Gottesmanbacteria bacterium]|nr:50S ribosomal protein L35 [Candidatus Gottesmanbacteria bacterium]
MSKQKTKKSILKRFKVTSSGKLFRSHPGSRHRRAHKTNRRIRHFSKPVEITKKQAKIVKALI